MGQFLDFVDTATVEGLVLERRRSRKGTEYTYRREVAPDPMLRAVLYLLAYSGMRRGEACGLRWENVDLGQGIIRVRRTRVMVGGKPIQSQPKTKRGRRALRIDPAVVEVLAIWKSEQVKLRLYYGPRWEDKGGHVFTHEMRFTKPARYGVPVRPDWVSKKHRQFARDAGLPPLRLHGLRTSWTTAAAESGEDPRAIADSLGHASEATMVRYYRKTFERVQERALTAVASAITQARAASPS